MLPGVKPPAGCTERLLLCIGGVGVSHPAVAGSHPLEPFVMMPAGQRRCAPGHCIGTTGHLLGLGLSMFDVVEVTGLFVACRTLSFPTVRLIQVSSK